jgi:hypothetical protein
MTEQIVIKLNKKRFRPLLDKLEDFGGECLAESDSDLVAKCLYFCYFFCYTRNKERGNKTNYQIFTEMLKLDKSDAILTFLSAYNKFKKKGLPNNPKNSKPKK